MIRVWLDAAEFAREDECCEFADWNEWPSVEVRREEEADERELSECELVDQRVIPPLANELGGGGVWTGGRCWEGSGGW